jgi:alkylation response protein AidB-like acyl-CoA dehydrogenase
LVVTGRLRTVPALAVAAAVVVPVRLSDGRTATAVLPTDRDGVRVRPESVTDRGSSATLDLDDVRVDAGELLDGDGDEVARWTLTRLRVAQAAVTVGVCAEAIAVTAAYTSQREQFGRPLSTNQGVSLRAADAHIDADAIRLSTLRAAWLLDLERADEAGSAALVASWWAKTAGLRIVHTTQHLHGGIGADVDYPIHRYFLWGRQAAFGLGSAAAVLTELGDQLPTAPAIGAPA